MFELKSAFQKMGTTGIAPTRPGDRRLDIRLHRFLKESMGLDG
jgi:hypothetical protein